MRKEWVLVFVLTGCGGGGKTTDVSSLGDSSVEIASPEKRSISIDITYSLVETQTNRELLSDAYSISLYPGFQEQVARPAVVTMLDDATRRRQGEYGKFYSSVLTKIIAKSITAQDFKRFNEFRTETVGFGIEKVSEHLTAYSRTRKADLMLKAGVDGAETAKKDAIEYRDQKASKVSWIVDHAGGEAFWGEPDARELNLALHKKLYALSKYAFYEAPLIDQTFNVIFQALMAFRAQLESAVFKREEGIDLSPILIESKRVSMTFYDQRLSQK